MSNIDTLIQSVKATLRSENQTNPSTRFSMESGVKVKKNQHLRTPQGMHWTQETKGTHAEVH